MSTWEERMSQRAKERMRKAAEAERQREAENDPHAEHHSHLLGTAVYCSCGDFRGITCAAFPPEWVCGARGVVGLKGG